MTLGLFKAGIMFNLVNERVAVHCSDFCEGSVGSAVECSNLHQEIVKYVSFSPPLQSLLGCLVTLLTCSEGFEADITKSADE